MHMSNNRLLVFARKPAPVQVTYLAYCGTTGLGTMDYRLTDPYLDPPGQDEQPYSEESIHLAETYWCYQPVIETPPVNALPALEAGHITFGCLNNFCKVSAPTLEAWSRLLRALPESRLLLHAQGGSHRDRVRDFLSQQGIAPDRVTFVGQLPLAEYFRIHGQMDVALDPFPYGGGTTTCDALWMGVPVVSLAGRTAVGRGGLSILSNVGLSDLVAQDPEDYVRICVELAQRSAASDRVARDLARSDAEIPVDGRPAVCAGRRGRLSHHVATLVRPARSATPRLRNGPAITSRNRSKPGWLGRSLRRPGGPRGVEDSAPATLRIAQGMPFPSPSRCTAFWFLQPLFSLRSRSRMIFLFRVTSRGVRPAHP